MQIWCQPGLTNLLCFVTCLLKKVFFFINLKLTQNLPFQLGPLSYTCFIFLSEQRFSLFVGETGLLHIMLLFWSTILLTSASLKSLNLIPSKISQ